MIAESFSGAVTGVGFFSPSAVTGTFTANIEENANGTIVGGSWSFTGSYYDNGVYVGLSNPNPGTMSGAISFSGSIASNLVLTASDSRFDSASTLFSLTKLSSGNYELAGQFDFKIPYTYTLAGNNISDIDLFSVSFDGKAAATPVLPPIISISQGSARIDASVGVASYTISRGPIPIGDTGSSVTIATHDGTAIAGRDYGSNSQTVSFAAGATTATFSVSIGYNAADAAAGINPDFTVVLSNPTNATIGNGSADTTILEDSGASASQAASDFAAGALSLPLAVSDSAAAILTNLNLLQSIRAAGKLASITLTDSAAPNLTVPAAELIADASALADISSAFSLTVAAGSSAVSIAGLSGHATTVAFTGNASQYSINTANGVMSVTSGSITDTLSGIAAITFSDLSEIVAATPGPANAVTTGNVTELYAAVLAREPDVGGLTFYQTYLQKNAGTPLQQFAEWFLSAAEYTSAHSYAQTAAADTQFINDSYQNLLHRTPAASEVSFYQTNVLAPAVASLAPGTPAYAAAQLQAHALMLVYFSASSEFLTDVQITALHPADAQHWLRLI